MCGICGQLNFSQKLPIEVSLLSKMISALSHRGPEEFGVYRDNKVGSLIVVDGDRCIGIVTERDLIEKVINKDIKTTLINEIMSINVITIDPLDNLENALKIMKKNRVKKLPVVSNNSLKGIITVTDIAYARPELTKRFIESWVKPRWDD